MLLKSQIEYVIKRQAAFLLIRKREIQRENLSAISPIDGFATVITGLRRCGKSTLLQQISKHYRPKDVLSLNFEDINLTGFADDDFKRLYTCITEANARVLFFDEIQIVNGWEIFVNQLLREGFVVYVTGSNASMLSVELGTHLTGRHISTELFPFSYSEYLAFMKKTSGETSFLQYLSDGGMPEYLASMDRRILLAIVDDVLVRDIAIRHNIRNVTPLKKMATYLLTNVSKPFTANRLTSVADNIAVSSALDYIAYLRDAYLIDTVGQYATNVRTTARNPKKVYAVDTGIANTISLSQTDDFGRLFENSIFLTLRKRHKDHLFYFRGAGECDFVVTDPNNKPQALYQVCLKLTDENIPRELGGLREAMSQLRIATGTLVTLSDSDSIEVAEGIINIIKAYDITL